MFGKNVNPMGSITTRINPYTGQLEYYSEDEDVGEAKPGIGGRVLGGACKCGKLQFRVEGTLAAAFWCHCHMCRRAGRRDRQLPNLTDRV